jgi:hypothetical protein
MGVDFHVLNAPVYCTNEQLVETDDHAIVAS